MSTTAPTNTQLKSDFLFEWKEVLRIQKVPGSNLDSMLVLCRLRQI